MTTTARHPEPLPTVRGTAVPEAGNRRPIHPIAALALVLLAVAAGCGRKGTAAGGGPAGSATPAADPGTIATIGGEAIPFRAFERYLADNAMDDSGEGEQEDTIKSRLLDQFLEEQLLLRAALALKVTVSEAEVDSFLEQIGVTEGEAEMTGTEGRQAFRDKVRQGLILQKVRDEAVLSKVQVSPGEIDDRLKKQPELLVTARRVVLRQIMVDDKALAERLRSGLAADPSRFEALARENSVSPDRGQPRGYSEEDLPVELRQPIFGLQAGQVSPVLENAQRYLIFQLVRKDEPRSADPAEVRHKVQLELMQRKGEEALARYIADLKKGTEVRVNRDVVPFNYVGEYR